MSCLKVSRKKIRAIELLFFQNSDVNRRILTLIAQFLLLLFQQLKKRIFGAPRKKSLKCETFLQKQVLDLYISEAARSLSSVY